MPDAPEEATQQLGLSASHAAAGGGATAMVGKDLLGEEKGFFLNERWVIVGVHHAPLHTQQFNRQHGRVGHVFQGRYKAILVDREPYLLELIRYVVLNPVRAGMVTSPEQWRWSSYQATVGQAPTPDWLATE